MICSLSFFLSVLFLTSGCMVGPDYTPPEIKADDAWALPVPTEEEPVDAWWTTFDEPMLDNYIALATLYNNNVKVAEATIAQAKAMRQVSASALFPQVSLDTNATHYFLSKNGPLFSFLPQAMPTLKIPRMLNIYNFNLDALWEIDLFGKIRRSIEASDAAFEGTIEQRNAILLSVLAEVASNYIQIRSAQTNGMLIEQNIALIEQNRSIITQRYQKGLGNSLDAQRLDAELAVARGALPPVVAQVFQGIYALSVLTGSLPETLLAELSCIKPLPDAPDCVSLGLRSDLLRRRPDVRNAERQLAVATAMTGVAVANFFPTFSLSGVLGLQSDHLHNLFRAKSKTWTYGADLYQPIFQGGQLVGNLKISEAQTAEAFFQYQQTVLAALQEAETALVAYVEDQKSVALLQEAVVKTGQVAVLTNQRFKNGLINVTDWLDSERQLIGSQQNLLTAQTNTLLDLVRLYKALGGGVDEKICATPIDL